MSAIIPVIPDASVNPINLVNAVQIVNNELLTNLDWLTKAFRVAFKHEQPEQSGGGTLPMVYDEDADYYAAIPNDDLQSYCFWYLEDDSKTPDFVGEDGFAFGQQVNINLVVWFNTKLIASGVFDEKIELIEEEILRVLETSAIDFEYQQIFRDYEQTFAAFDVDNEVNTQYLTYPYFGFRFQGTLKYNRFCNAL